jgi:hypothetical protein
MFYYKRKNNIIYDKAIIEYFKRLGFPLLFVFQEQSRELCLEAINQKYYTINALKSTKEQTNELCEIAVEKDGMALQYVTNQNDKICEIAVKQNGLALQFVKNKKYFICLEAIKQNPRALQYINFNEDNDYNYKLYLESCKNLENKNESNEVCSVCLTNDKNTYCEIIECKHSFHIKCLLKWIKHNNTCPNCRTIIT